MRGSFNVAFENLTLHDQATYSIGRLEALTAFHSTLLTSSSFLHTRHPDGSPFSLEEAERECFLLTVASQDTTAALITPLISYIAQDIAIASKLSEEICLFEKQGKLSSPVAKYEETASMPYFNACVRETLRIRPPTPVNLPRYVAEGGMVIGGVWVPETVEVAANPHLIHRNRDIFGQDVDSFRPERWLENTEQRRLMEKYDFAWGYGSRRCAGKSIALMDSHKFVLQVSSPLQDHQSTNGSLGAISGLQGPASDATTAMDDAKLGGKCLLWALGISWGKEQCHGSRFKVMTNMGCYVI